MKQATVNLLADMGCQPITLPVRTDRGDVDDVDVPDRHRTVNAADSQHRCSARAGAIGGDDDVDELDHH